LGDRRAPLVYAQSVKTQTLFPDSAAENFFIGLVGPAGLSRGCGVAGGPPYWIWRLFARTFPLGRQAQKGTGGKSCAKIGCPRANRPPIAQASRPKIWFFPFAVLGENYLCVFIPDRGTSALLAGALAGPKGKGPGLNHFLRGAARGRKTLHLTVFSQKKKNTGRGGWSTSFMARGTGAEGRGQGSDLARKSRGGKLSAGKTRNLSGWGASRPRQEVFARPPRAKFFPVGNKNNFRRFAFLAN